MGIARVLIGQTDATKDSFVWDGSISGFCLLKPRASNQRCRPLIWLTVCPFIALKTAGAFPFEGSALLPEKCVGERVLREGKLQHATNERFRCSRHGKGGR